MDASHCIDTVACHAEGLKAKITSKGQTIALGYHLNRLRVGVALKNQRKHTQQAVIFVPGHSSCRRLARVFKGREVGASTLTFTNPLTGLIERTAGPLTACFSLLLGIINSNSLMNLSTKL